MPSTQLTFGSREAHRAWLETQSRLPLGFRVGTARFEFVPLEVPKPAWMNLTLIAVDVPTPSFAAMFTRNAFPGAPVTVGRARLSEPRLAAWVVNNKISRAPRGASRGRGRGPPPRLGCSAPARARSCRRRPASSAGDSR
jgi:glutamate N-acetyltransferase/amino-acid N-acetyltransferase